MNGGELIEREEVDHCFGDLIADLPIGLYRRDLSGRLLAVNRSLVRMLAYSNAEALLEVPAASLYVDPTVLGRWKALLDRSGMLSAYQVELKRWDGRGLWCEETTRKRVGENGEVIYEGCLIDISRRKRFQDQLIHLSSFDLLTGVHNRHRFEEMLTAKLYECSRYGSTGAVLWLDLDNFRDLNERFGHRAGDELLVAVAAALRANLRTNDIVARLGGDDFTILLPHADTLQARRAAEKLLRNVCNSPMEIAGVPVRMTASAGISIFPIHGDNTEELLAKAELARYRAKERGRNRVEVFDADIDLEIEVARRIDWVRRMREALEQERLALWAQPVVRTSDRKTTGCEMLLRLIDTDGTIHSPVAFLGVAERSGLMRDIDQWVVAQAIELAEGIEDDFEIAVNLSGTSVEDEQVAERITKLVTSAGPRIARRLTFEITEQAAVASMHRAQSFIRGLRRLGCRFALDDFGVGFSSFSHLKHLDVDILKIDGSFVRNIDSQPVDHHLVRAMVTVARGLGKTTVAEFVESSEVLEAITALGVDYAQGYYLGEPRPAEELLS